MKKYGTMWYDLIVPLLNSLKTKEKIHFIILNYTPDYTLYPNVWIFVQVNNKLNIGVQNVTRS